MKLHLQNYVLLLFLFSVPSKQIQQLTCRIFHMLMYTIAHSEGMGARSCKYLRIHK